MDNLLRSLAALFLVLSSLPANAQQPTPVCSRPNARCPSSYTFAPYHLPFNIKEKLVFGTVYKSQQFYAVVLKSIKAAADPDCSHVSEAERLESQKIWPDRKVFASRYSCPEELIAYENVDQDFNFLAVYAGTTLSEARRVLSLVKKNGRYPRAYIKQMRVVLDYST